jgi:hypothetical protein
MCGFSSYLRSFFVLTLLLISNFSNAAFTVDGGDTYTHYYKLGTSCDSLESCLLLFPKSYPDGAYDSYQLDGFHYATHNAIYMYYRRTANGRLYSKNLHFLPGEGCVMDFTTVMCGLSCTSLQTCQTAAQNDCSFGVSNWQYTDYANYSFSCSEIQDLEGEPVDINHLPDEFIITGFAKGDRGLPGQSGSEYDDTALKSDISNNVDNIAALSQSNSILSNKQSSLSSSVSNNTESISSNANSLSALSSDTSSLLTNQDSIRSDVSTNSQSVSSNANSLSTLFNDTGSMLTKQDLIRSDVSTNSQSVSSNANSLSSLFNDTGSLLTKQDLIRSDVSTNSQSVSSNANSLSTLFNNTGSMLTKQDLIRSDVSTNTQSINNLASNQAQSCSVSKSGDVTTINCPDGDSSISETLIKNAVHDDLKSEFCFVSGVDELTNKTTYSCPSGNKIVQVSNGAKGDKGDKGDEGVDGVDGDDGNRGFKGDKGDEGLDGVDGDDGDKGTEGKRGIKGLAGLNGSDGEDGKVVDMNTLIDYLSNTSFDFGNWESKSNSKFNDFSQGKITSNIDVTSEATSYLSGKGVVINSNTCPSPETITILGSDVSLSYQPMCDLASLLNPVFLAFIWISAMVLYFRSL